MILIVKRDDLPEGFRDQPAKDLHLNQLGLPAELTNQADLIVLVEGSEIKFLKHFPEIQSQDSIDVLVRYITSTDPVKKTPPIRVKRTYRRKSKL